MTTPLLELEGTWEEIAAEIPDFASQKLRVLVHPAEVNRAAAYDTRPISEVLAEIAGTIPPAELASYRQTSPTNLTTISTARPNDRPLLRRSRFRQQVSAGVRAARTHITPCLARTYQTEHWVRGLRD